MANSNPLNSGDGSRPTTDGTVDNVGAGKAFVPGKGDSSSPAANEKSPDHKADRASVKRDDSDAFHLHESSKTETNKEPLKTAEENNKRK